MSCVVLSFAYYLVDETHPTNHMENIFQNKKLYGESDEKQRDNTTFFQKKG